ncbi:MAG: MAPEG family protein [Pseudomonadota bacterium]|nr:MAPEG family protein [Pseudomonadota bacterium]
MNTAWVDLVAALAVVQFLFFGFLVGRARGQYGVKAPAISGHEGFERIYRVQINTLEVLFVFLPSLYLAARHWPVAWVVALGAVYLIGRLVYWRAYVRNPASRALGFMLSMFPAMGLLLLALLGIVRTLI